jgi:hypothetical protein
VIGIDGTALVASVEHIEDHDGSCQIHLHVLAVERRGTRWRLSPGEAGTVPLAEVESVRAVVFLSGSGM